MGCKVRIITSRSKLLKKNYHRDSYEVLEKIDVGSRELNELLTTLVNYESEDELNDE